MNPNEIIELTKKINDAHSDIDKLNKTIAAHPYGKKQRDLFYKISTNIDYDPFIVTLKAERKLFGNMSFESLNYTSQRTVLIMLRDAIQLFIKAKAIEETVDE